MGLLGFDDGRGTMTVDLSGQAVPAPQTVLCGPDHADEYLSLEYLASEPYTRFVYGSEDAARAAHHYLFSQRLCEFAPPFGRLLVAGERLAAMASWLTGEELQRIRLRAAVALARGGFFRHDVDLRRRTQLAATTLVLPQPHDLYLSRLAVARHARGRGLAQRLLSEFESDARRRGCKRLVFEVSPVHAAAGALYRGAGFIEIGSHEVVDPVTGRELAYYIMSKPS